MSNEKHLANRMGWRWFILPFHLALLCSLAGATSAQVVSTTRSSREIERKVSYLLLHMTLEEKIGQLQQLCGAWDGNCLPEDFELARKGMLGSTIFIRGAKRTSDLQRVAVTESRLHIPILFAFNVIHGYRTIFP